MNKRDYWHIAIQAILALAVILAAIVWLATDHQRLNELQNWRAEHLLNFTKVVDTQTQMQIVLQKLETLQEESDRRVSKLEESRTRDPGLHKFQAIKNLKPGGEK
jgi:hypothetical protein